MKNYKIIFSFLLVVGYCNLHAQDRFYTKSGQISFFSKAPLESIEAGNKNVTCVLDTKTGQLQFVVLMKGFEFKKALMQEHFNEKYMESERFPAASFSGKIIEDLDLTKDGTYEVRAKGDLEIHGVKQIRIIKSKLTVSKGKVSIDTNFTVPLSDHNITIPKIVGQKIATEIEVFFSSTMVLN